MSVPLVQPFHLQQLRRRFERILQQEIRLCLTFRERELAFAFLDLLLANELRLGDVLFLDLFQLDGTGNSGENEKLVSARSWALIQYGARRPFSPLTISSFSFGRS